MMREPTFDRRLLLKAEKTLSASAAPAPAFAGTAAAASRPVTGVSVFPFPLSAVRLQAGPFLDNMNRQLAYVRFVDADRLLHTFRTNAGLASSAQPCGGWESPTTELRGHSTGHLLSGLAQAYANTGDTAYKTKGDYLVNALAACQAGAPGRGFHAGYLSAFPENFFDRLESGQSVWAPYYTLHKIMAGAAAPVPPGRQPAGPRRPAAHGGLDEDPHRSAVHHADAGCAAHGVRWHAGGPDKPVPGHRRREPPRHGAAVRPRPDPRPAGRELRPARRVPRQHPDPQDHRCDPRVPR